MGVGVLDPALANRDQELSQLILSGNAGEPVVSVYFGFDEFNIRPSERPKLEELVAYLNDHLSVKIIAEGHTSWRGTEEYNLGLGDRRGNAVRNYLVNLGVEASRINVLSKGELDATQDVEKEDPRAVEDRRVDVILAQ